MRFFNAITIIAYIDKFFTVHNPLRITGGTARGLRLTGPKSSRGGAIRPTSDRVREALFNILGDRIKGAVVLDLFAGTGALGLEALSRGANYVIFVDQSAESIELVRQNLLSCFKRPAASILRANLNKNSTFSKITENSSGRSSFNLVFLDPPYEKKLAMLSLIMLQKAELLAPGAHIVVEERWHEQLPPTIGKLRLKTNRRYGETGIWIYEHSDPLQQS